VGLRQAAPLHQILREKIGHVVADAPDLESAVDRTARRRVCSSPNGFWTSNNTRDLSAALKRRCLRLFLDYPSAERELEIIRSKETGLPEVLTKPL
jgi:MoxR-like ATPase